MLQNLIRAHLGETGVSPARSYIGAATVANGVAEVSVWSTDGTITLHKLPLAYSSNGTPTILTGTLSVLPGFDAKLVSMLVARLRPDLRDNVARAKDCLKASAAALEKARTRTAEAHVDRNRLLAELWQHHGYTRKTALYTLVHITRTELDRAIEAYRRESRTGGTDSVEDAVRAYEKSYRQAEREADTLEAFRDMLIIELRGGIRYGQHGVQQVAWLAGVSHPRITQICTPDYRAKRTVGPRCSLAAR